MSHWITPRRATLVAAAALLAVAWTVGAPAHARGKRIKGPGTIGRLDAPLGLQGTNGAGGQVVLPFTIVDRKPRHHRVEAEWAFDRNGDGRITSDEFVPLTQAPRDPRDTGRLRRARSRFPRVTYKSARNLGAAHAFVWDAAADVPDGRFVLLDLEHTATGRTVVENGQPVVSDTGTGVQVRVRLVQGRGPRARGPFIPTPTFSLDNAARPEFRSLRADAAAPGEFTWVGAQASSRPLAIHFDHLPAQGRTSLDPAERPFLDWRPCTLDAARSDGEVGLASSPDGVEHRFAWDAAADLGEASGEFFIRAAIYDEQSRLLSGYLYLLAPIRLGD